TSCGRLYQACPCKRRQSCDGRITRRFGCAAGRFSFYATCSYFEREKDFAETVHSQACLGILQNVGCNDCADLTSSTLDERGVRRRSEQDPHRGEWRGNYFYRLSQDRAREMAHLHRDHYRAQTRSRTCRGCDRGADPALGDWASLLGARSVLLEIPGA